MEIEFVSIINKILPAFIKVRKQVLGNNIKMPSLVYIMSSMSKVDNVRVVSDIIE